MSKYAYVMTTLSPRWTGWTAGLLFLVFSHPVVAAALLDDWKITVISGRPDMVSGNDALVRVSPPNGIAPAEFRVLLNGLDVTKLFRPAQETGSLVARLEGLNTGANTVEVTAGKKRKARAELINYPITGPIFSGPHQAPFVCQTAEAGLGEPLDAACSARTLVRYFYKSTAAPAAGPVPEASRRLGIPPGFKPLDLSGPKPTDVAQVTSLDGHTVDYIVRQESGTINRAIYAIAFLHRPEDPLPDPWTRTPGWNGRLVYLFGGGCGAGYHQSLPPSVMNDLFFSQGYAVATASLNVFGNNCNDVISAETMMMVKEHFIEQFGVPVHTVGWGGSGGSMQQHLIAQNYPGLLDGLLPMVSFPDIISLITPAVDCALLDRAFKTSSLSWTDEQKTAVSGFATWKTVVRWNGNFSPGLVLPTRCNPSVPKSLVYDAATNPTGARCGIYDNQVNMFGRDPKTGFARQPLDNVGVQYGLDAFNSGRITAEQFLDLNERIGGYDTDGKMVPRRTVADPEALRLAYQTGRINTGTGGLTTIPIIDVRTYWDPAGDIHDRFRSLSMRDRLKAANGNADNHVIFTLPGSAGQGEPTPTNTLNLRMGEALRLMEVWLTNIEKDASAEAGVAKVARNKPPELVDACWTAAGEKIAEPQTYKGTGRCNLLFPSHADPRVAAGAPLAGNVLKCALKAVDPNDYTNPLAAEQLQRLKTIFSQGVCDYTRPGVGQQQAEGTWRRY
ncbi:MAG: DUF6351 family protein [Acidobacteriota bacterium]